MKRKPAKISALLSDKIYQYEWLSVEEISPSHQSRIIEQTDFIHFSL